MDRMPPIPGLKRLMASRLAHGVCPHALSRPIPCQGGFPNKGTVIWTAVCTGPQTTLDLSRPI